MTITRRPALPSDIEFARGVHHRGYRDVVIDQFGAWDEQVQDRFFLGDWHGGHFEIIVCDGIPCGYLSMEERADSIGVREIVVMPEFQGRGIGTSILIETIDRASKSGRRVLIGALHRNRALNLYRRLGFRESEKTATHTCLEWTPAARGD